MTTVALKFLLFGTLFCCLLSCYNTPYPDEVAKTSKTADTTASELSLPSLPVWRQFFIDHPNYQSDGFDYPVGKPNAKDYYNAQPYGENAHLGDDWNAVTGGNSDLGHPMYSIANGYVTFAEDVGGGWGNVVRIVHQLNDSTYVESLYAHCDTIIVDAHQGVKRGDLIATIGNANGAYYAHLHFEMRDSIDMPIGGGYGMETDGYIDPTPFIKNNRPQ